ncbi:LIC_10042 family TonB-like protein [Leptospira idonii]
MQRLTLFLEKTTKTFSRIWLLSLSFHLSLLFLFYYSSDTESLSEKIHLTQGSALRMFSNSPVPLLGTGKTSSQFQETSDREGTKDTEEEIQSFRNTLSYPLLALEQRLEDDCSFRVTVAENGDIEKVVVLVPCRYNVFEDQFRKQIQNWNFKSSRGKEIVLPIRFRIHARE